jgi:cystathionine beta-lyase/cystathionine gamma-synthase
MPILDADVAICLGPDEPEAPPPTPMSAPIVQTSLFGYPSFRALVDALSAERRQPVYSRGRNPTVTALERKLAALERGERCMAFGSGMAAISAAMLGLLEAGDHVLFVNHTYGPTLQLAEHLGRFGIRHDVTLDGDSEAVERALRPETRLVWLESPGTMMFRTVDVAGIAALAKSHGALSCMDNSWATPLFQKPVEAGVDLVVHSASKYLAGHSDVVAGALVTREELHARIHYRALMLNGGILGPFEAWLLLRGLRTLPARMGIHERDGLEVARFLAGHPAVARVHHPGLDDAGGPGAGNGRTLAGSSGLFSFELRRATFDAVAAVIDGLELFRIGVSWGGAESLVISPERDASGTGLADRGLPRGLIRLSVGLDGANALIADLERALERAG